MPPVRWRDWNSPPTAVLHDSCLPAVAHPTQHSAAVPGSRSTALVRLTPRSAAEPDSRLTALVRPTRRSAAAPGSTVRPPGAGQSSAGNWLASDLEGYLRC